MEISAVLASAEDRDGKAGTGGALAGTDGLAGGPVRTGVHGQVGVITLDDQRHRNAIGAQMANGVVAALESLRARHVRVVVLRAAAGMDVWSAGHDINELPRGRRDPLGYNDSLEEMLRAIRTFPMPVVAMVHGTVWGGAMDLVLSCDLVTADETASFAITAANLGLPYNTTGLLHFLGRLPVNLVKEMFFTAAPLDAKKARECLLVNHLVSSAELEAFTLELAAIMVSSRTTSPSRRRCTNASRGCAGRLTTAATISRVSTPSPRNARQSSGVPETSIFGTGSRANGVGPLGRWSRGAVPIGAIGTAAGRQGY
jgi:methylmalonyl-CoA decarboxylase